MVRRTVCILELADLERSVVVDGASTVPAVIEEDEDDHNNMLHLCSELIRSSATKVKGCCSFLFCAIFNL